MSATIQITFLVEEIPHCPSFPHNPVVHVDLFILSDIQLQTVVDNLHVLVRI